MTGRYYAQIFRLQAEPAVLVVDLLLLLRWYMCVNASTQLASGRGLDQHGLRLLCHMLLLCSAWPSGNVYVLTNKHSTLTGLWRDILV